MQNRAICDAVHCKYVPKPAERLIKPGGAFVSASNAVISRVTEPPEHENDQS